MKIGKVEKYLHEKRSSDGALFFAIIDPLDYCTKEKAIQSAKEAYEAGADMIVVGGSMGIQGHTLDDTLVGIKENIAVPLTLFPGDIGTVSAKADAIYFMSMINSRNTYWISGAQTIAAPMVKILGIEALPVAYIVVGEAGTVAWVGDTKAIPFHKPKLAAATALAAQYMGFRFVFTDAGSAAPQPVPPEIVKAVRQTIDSDMFYIDAGGIRSEKQVSDAIRAGADAVQLGTVIEKAKNVKNRIGTLVKVVKREGKKRI